MIAANLVDASPDRHTTAADWAAQGKRVLLFAHANASTPLQGEDNVPLPARTVAADLPAQLYR